MQMKGEQPCRGRVTGAGNQIAELRRVRGGYKEPETVEKMDLISISSSC